MFRAFDRFRVVTVVFGIMVSFSKSRLFSKSHLKAYAMSYHLSLPCSSVRSRFYQTIVYPQISNDSMYVSKGKWWILFSGKGNYSTFQCHYIIFTNDFLYMKRALFLCPVHRIICIISFDQKHILQYEYKRSYYILHQCILTFCLFFYYSISILYLLQLFQSMSVALQSIHILQL